MGVYGNPSRLILKTNRLAPFLKICVNLWMLFLFFPNL